MATSDAVDAAASALSHLASSSTAPDAQAVLNTHSDTFTQALKETHVRLRDEIDRGHEPSPYSHTVQDARAKSTLVGLQASLMAAHLSSMLQRMDENAPS